MSDDGSFMPCSSGLAASVMVTDGASADGDRAAVMQELAQMKMLREWTTLQGMVLENLSGGGKSGNARQALSQHTTTSCQPRRNEHMRKISLKSLGLEQPVPADGGIKVIIHLPCAYEFDDNNSIEY